MDVENVSPDTGLCEKLSNSVILREQNSNTNVFKEQSFVVDHEDRLH